MRLLLLSKRLLLLAVLLSGGQVQAQEPDTLDARGYFPLAVGNEWEYRLDLTRPAHMYRPQDESRTEYARFRIVADDVGPERNHFALVEERLSSDGTLLRRDTSSVRFDAETASVLALRTRENGQSYEEPFPFFACDLDLSFGGDEHSACWVMACQEEIVLRELFGSGEPVKGKMFTNFVYAFTAVHDVGFVYGGGGCHPCSVFSDYDGWTLAFAEVDGKTYGTRTVGVETPPRTPSSTRLVVYPNPTLGPVVVRGVDGMPVGDPVEVYDVAGRRVWTFSPSPSGVISLDLSGLPSGLYLIRVGEQVGKVIVE